MKILWCWRCNMDIPMLDDDEFKRCLSFKGTGTGDLREREFEPVLEEYERITGFHETNINAFYHHVCSMYGPPCSNCLKPLRTPAAKMCAACGQPTEAANTSSQKE
jgi:hypothetical protein